MSKHGPNWIVRRLERLELDEWTCQDCGDGAWQVHHEEYAPEGKTASLDMVVSLCPYCHGDRHGISLVPPAEKPATKVKKTITIQDHHEEWLQDNYLHLSSIIQEALDEEIKKSA
jgi:5-methylcytosine-specific restriction endonuclease McrA